MIYYENSNIIKNFLIFFINHYHILCNRLKKYSGYCFEICYIQENGIQGYFTRDLSLTNCLIQFCRSMDMISSWIRAFELYSFLLCIF